MQHAQGSLWISLRPETLVHFFSGSRDRYRCGKSVGVTNFGATVGLLTQTDNFGRGSVGIFSFRPARKRDTMTMSLTAWALGG